MPFHFFELPQEIQDNIYRKYYEDARTEAIYDTRKFPRRSKKPESPLEDRLLFQFKPGAALLLVCRRIHRAANPICKAAQEQNLVIKNKGWTREDLEAILNSDRYTRLHDRVRHIQFEHFTCHGPDLWSRFLLKFHKVKSFDLAIETTSFGQTHMKPLLDRVLTDPGYGGAQRFVRYGALSLAINLQQKYGQRYKIVATSTCTWHLFGNGGSLRCVCSSLSASCASC